MAQQASAIGPLVAGRDVGRFVRRHVMRCRFVGSFLVEETETGAVPIEFSIGGAKTQTAVTIGIR